MLIRMAGNTSVAAILLLLAGVQAHYSVTLSSQSLCAFTRTTVKISCKYTKPSYSRVREREWYQLQSSDGEEQVLSKDPDNSARVSVSTRWNDCDLTVRDVRVRDSGVYNFRFRTSSSDWISASSGVNLTVTELQVKVDPKTAGQSEVKVICSSTCRLRQNLYYNWYRRKTRFMSRIRDNFILLNPKSLTEGGSYYCEVSDGSMWHRSDPVCVLGDCWGVTYTPERVCALKGSSVDLSCSYNPGGHTVTKSVWFIKEQAGAEPVDLQKDAKYQGRVQYRQSVQNDCSMRITHLRESDTQTYRFRFYTDGSQYTGKAGVTLSVTGLQVTVSNTHMGKQLMCSSTCTLPNKPTYIWYRNGKPIDNWYSNGLYLYVSSMDAGSYSCAVRGHEELHSPAVCVFDQNSCWSVSYSTQTICALIGSSVDIHGYYTFSDQLPDPQLAWYIKLLLQEKELSSADGRVEFFSDRANMNTLRLKHLTESDSAEYLLRFKSPYWYHTHSSPAVSLSVTGLQVKVEPVAVTMSEEQTLICSSTCTLPNNPTYIWYRNGQPVAVPYMHSSWLYLSVSPMNAGSYSCAVKGHEELRSPAICVYNWNSCWSVSYFTQTICALTGSSVDIHGYYTFPHQLPDPQPAWYIRILRQDTELSPAEGRVEFFSDKANMNTLRLKHLTESDSAKYLLRFKAHLWYGIDSSAGVSLSVTGLQVKVEPVAITVSEEQRVTLMCSGTCTLPNKPTYIWYKNRQPVFHCKSASCSVAVVSGEVSYSCAVQGYESLLSPPVYSPRNTRAVIVSSGERVEGDSVTLSCSSDANPPVLIYSWFKQRAAADAPLTTGQNYTITNISSQHSGLYYCTAHNQLGEHSSTPTHLDVLYSPRNTRAVVISSGERVEGDSVTLSCSSDADPPVLIYSWFKQTAAADAPLTTGQNYTITNISSQHSGLYYCTAHNQLGQHSSTPTHLDVLYPPRPPSVSEHVSGSSITLVCVSDSNPASSYFWYKKTGSDIQLIGNSTNLTLATRAHGPLYCMAMNQYGSYNSSVSSFISGNTSAKYAASSVTVIFLLTFIAAFLWMRRRAAPASKRGEEKSGRDECAPVYDNVSAMLMTSAPTRTAASDDEVELNYTTVRFTRSPPLYSTVQLPNALKQDEDVQYATVTLSKPRAIRNPIYGTGNRT
ncbi:sialoadhesin-like [Colossoma macropomum]|uniref:sialoadhesin-like n=1 Tax=Colossoma macropomum TaxID=42526 RepID=UPI001863B279|nr:sialoadhesin-like [Colossoma macropomum]